MEGTMGCITPFAAEWAPKNWASCNGQLMSISQNQALYSLLGTTYGGDGVQTFALPDLRGRRAVSAGQGLGLNNYPLGGATGAETTTLGLNNLPAHAHNGNIAITLDADDNEGSVNRAAGTYPAILNNCYAKTPSPTPPPNQMVNPNYSVTVAPTGGGQSFNTLMPYLVVNFVICLAGIYPSRN